MYPSPGGALRRTLVLVVILYSCPGFSQPTSSAAAAIAKWEAFERREFPEDASLRGHHDADARLTDVSEAAVFRRRKFVRDFLGEVRAIRRAGLSEQERVSLDLLAYELAQLDRLGSLYGKLPFGAFDTDFWMPFSSLGGVHTSLVILAQSTRFDTQSDYENYLTRLASVPRAIDDLMARMETALNSGWIAPAAPLERLPRQLSGFAGESIADGPLMAPFAGAMKGVDGGAGEQLRARARDLLVSRLAPAFARLKQFFEARYIPAARDVPLSVSRLPGGKRYYDLLAERWTTSTLSPERIHAIGMQEVERLSGEIRRTLDTAGFHGSLSEFVAAKRADPAQRYASAEDMLAGYRNIAKIADAALPALFAELPRLPYGVRAMQPFEGDNAEYYIRGSGDGARAGYFMANVNRLDRRGRFEMEALLLHEAVPGHHLQFARAMELRSLPEFRRNAFFPAYIEGWGLYAESLGESMGLYREAGSKIGYLSFAILRAARLVVDTGLHRYDWTRPQAIDFLVQRGGVEPGFAAAEVDRYISNPGQALAYKIGELKIRELRDAASRRLGDRFDLRRFHNAVLDDGPLPLDVLERRIDRFIDRASGDAATRPPRRPRAPARRPARRRRTSPPALRRKARTRSAGPVHATGSCGFSAPALRRST